MTRIAAIRIPHWWRMLRVRTWHRIATLSMVVLLLLGSANGILNSEAQRLQLEHQTNALAASAPTLNERPAQEPLSQVAPPSPSGAYLPFPLNHTLDGETASYDWNNRLVAATTSGATVTYTYAGDGLRASRTVAGVTTPFLWDRASGLPEIIDDGTTVSVQSPAGLLAAVDGSTGAATYPLTDAIGSNRLETNDLGAVTNTTDYDAFGNVRATTGTTSTSGWAGEQGDPDTGSVYLRARDYDPLTGRFTSRDSVSPNGAFTQGFNTYAYTGNNPVTRTDPGGHSWLDGVSGAMTALANVTSKLVETLRSVAHNDNLPKWAKEFLVALVVFGLQMLLFVQVMVMVSVISEATGIGKFMVGRAMFLSRLPGLSGMAKLVAKCTEMVACRNMGRFLIQNGDCALAIAFTALSIATTGVPSPITGAGAAALTTDGADIFTECRDRNPGYSPNGSSAGRKADNYCSFSGDTNVLMADGSHKAIAEIKPGDWVFAEDPETGESGAKLVTALWEHQDTLITLQTSAGPLRTTENHPFWDETDQAWEPAETLDSGDLLNTSTGETVTANGLDWSAATGGMAYNLTVAELHTYFVVIDASSVLVHNSCGKRPNFDATDPKKKPQMTTRGWTEEEIIAIVDNPPTTYRAVDKSTGQAATAYYRSNSEYVVVNDVSGAIIQISDKNRPDWNPDSSIEFT